MSNSKFLTEIDTIYSTEKTRSIAREVGGIKQSTDLTNKTVKQILKEILQPYRAPDIDIFTMKLFNNDNLNVVNKILEKGGNTNFSIKQVNIQISVWSNNVSSIGLYIENDAEPINGYSVSNPTILDDYTIQLNFGSSINADTKLAQLKTDTDDTIYLYLKVYDGQNTITKAITGSYIRPYYYGVFNESVNINIDELIDSNKKITKFSSGTQISCTGDNKTSQYTAIAIPYSYNKEITIKDSKNLKQDWYKVMNGNSDKFIYKTNGIELAYRILKSDISVFSSEKYTFTY